MRPALVTILLFVSLLPVRAQEAARLEAQLVRNPDNAAAHATLIDLYFRQGAAKDAQQKRVDEIVWMIEHHPEQPVLGTAAATEDDPPAYAIVDKAWRKVVTLPSPPPAALANAAFFYKFNDRPFAAELLDRAIQLAPANSEYRSALGYLYALAILGVTQVNHNLLPEASSTEEAHSAFAQTALARLKSTANVPELLSAANAFAFDGSMLRATGRLDLDLAPISEELLTRAEKLDPVNPRVATVFAQYYQSRYTSTRDPAEQQTFARLWLSKSKIAVTYTTDPEEKFSLQTDLAKAAWRSGDLPAAKQYAQELLKSAERQKQDWNYGNALHQANLILGLCALAADDVQAADGYLLASGNTPGSPQLNSFGPNMSLASKLLERQQQQTVLQYLDLCAKFWKMDRGLLARWKGEVRDGNAPKFGANLIY